MRCIKTGVTLVADHARWHGDAFILTTDGQRHPEHNAGYNDEPSVGRHWLLVRTCAERTAQEDWHELGPVDHIEAEAVDHHFEPGTRHGTMLVAPFRWRWLGYNGRPL